MIRLIRCDLPGCSDVALMVHATGCKSASCATHAYPGTTCPSCLRPYAMVGAAS